MFYFTPRVKSLVLQCLSSIILSPLNSNVNWSLAEQLAGQRQPTQFGRALQQLGVTFIAAHSPQAKGRVERLWGLLQDRLCSELRLAQAGDIDSANAVLRPFIADYNRRFARTPSEHRTIVPRG